LDDDAPRAAGAPVELPVRLARQHRARVLTAAVQDGPAVAALLVAGAAGLRAPRGGGDLLLALVELAVGAWVLRYLARAAVSLFPRGGAEASDAAAATGAPAPGQGDAPRVRWEGVAVGTMALVEVWHRWLTTGHVARPTLLVGVLTLALALGGARVVQRRTAHLRPRLVVSAAGLFYRGSRRRRFEARWDDVARVEQASGALRLVLRDGREWTLRAGEHLEGSALVAGAAAAVRANAPPRLTPAALMTSPPAAPRG
jgi:hypothetical protein